MPDLDFQVESVAPVSHAAASTLSFKLRLTASTNGSLSEQRGDLHIHSVLLRCQLRLEPGRRRYSPDEQKKLFDLFGEPHRWGQTVRSMLWVNQTLVVPAFAGQTVAELTVPCTYDFNIASAKYFDALTDGSVPLSLLFSGTIFYAGDDGALQIEQIPWEKEADFALPVRTWRQMMDLYYPNCAWICLRKDLFDRLQERKRALAAINLDQAIEGLLERPQDHVFP